MEEKQINWGILGTSFISEVMAKAIQESDGGRLIAVAGRTASKVKNFKQRFNIQKSYVNYQDLINDKTIDAVYIGLPNHFHKEWMVRAAKMGKHILCEKPFAISVNEIKEVMDVVEQSEVICMEAIMYRYHPFIHKLKELINSGIVGKINFIQARYTANISEIANPVEGGGIRNLGCYPVSLARYLIGSEPIEIHGMGRLNESKSSDNQASVMLKFPGNIMATISAADDMEMSWQFDIYGTQGSLKVLSNPWLPDLTNRILVQGKNTEEMIIPADKSLYRYQIECVNRSINGNTLSGVSLEESLGNTVVLEIWREQVFRAEECFCVNL